MLLFLNATMLDYIEAAVTTSLKEIFSPPALCLVVVVDVVDVEVVEVD